MCVGLDTAKQETKRAVKLSSNKLLISKSRYTNMSARRPKKNRAKQFDGMLTDSQVYRVHC
jgi:hypothetical protein